MVEPQDAGLLENEAAKILCGAHGMPAPTISWFRVEGTSTQKETIILLIGMWDCYDNRGDPSSDPVEQ